jgi:hypothetical protein
MAVFGESFDDGGSFDEGNASESFDAGVPRVDADP